MDDTPSQEELDEVVDWCNEADKTGSHHPEMTFEMGVCAAIFWMMGQGESPIN